MKSRLRDAKVVLDRAAKRSKSRPWRSLAIIMATVAGTIALMAVPALADTGPQSPGAAQPARRAVVPLADAGGFVVIVEDRTGSCIDLPRGNNTPNTGAQEFRCNGGDNQKFRPFNLGNGFFLLQNKANLLCLAPRDDFVFSRVVQVNCDAGAQRQSWQFQVVPEDPSHLWLASGFAGKCAQLDPDTNRDGTPISLGMCAFDNRMFWHFQ